MLTESFEGKIYSRIEILPHEDRARIAETAAREAARELEIVPTPKVRFFCPAYLGETVWGHIANDGEIHVNANQSDADVIRTVIHEIRHLWQQQSPKWRDRSAAIKENDARLFELAWPRSAIDRDNFRKLMASNL